MTPLQTHFHVEKSRLAATDAKSATVAEVTVMEQARQAERVNQHEWVVSSSRIAGLRYRVRRQIEGWQCQCAGYLKAKTNDHDCRHIQAVEMREAGSCLRDKCKYCKQIAEYLARHREGRAPYRCPASADLDARDLAARCAA